MLTVAVMLIPITIAMVNPRLPRLATLSLLALPFLILSCAAAFMVRGYTIANGALIIQRTGWVTTIPLHGITSVALMPDAMRASIRLCGNGGAFSFTGLFWNKMLGKYRAYVTDLHQTVVLKIENRTIVISPDAPDRFVAELQSRAGPNPRLISGFQSRRRI
jgi:hypothetical protein